MNTQEERDARLAAALDIVTGDETERQMASLRMFAGTASGAYRPGWRFWNWLVDAEYVAVGPAPIWWFVLGAVVVVVVVLAVIL